MEEQSKKNKKSIRKEAGRIGRGLIGYSIITFVVVIVHLFILESRWADKYPGATEQDATYIQMMENFENSGTSSMIGVGLGVVFLLFFFRKRINVSSIVHAEKKMNATAFFQLLCVFMGGQLLFSTVGELLEKGLNLFGYSALACMESASSVSTTLSMFLYSSIIGPIAEELVYRGFVLRSFQKYGKIAAIVVSSVLFGVMHANIPQSIFAFGVGMVLGYVAVEYSIVWSVLLHIINNCIFCDVFGWMTSGFNEQIQEVLSVGVFAAFAVAGAVVLWRKREAVKTFCGENRTEKGIYVHIFSALGMIFFIAGELGMAILMLEKV